MSRKNGFQIVIEKYNLPIYQVPFVIIYYENGDIIAEDKDKRKFKNYRQGNQYFWNNFVQK